jgi:glycosyltransferase involved in cell wall biosynthesis
MDCIPTITVLMCVYNDALFLPEAVESILAQTFTNFDFIIINDGSTDRSPEILQNYAKQDPRIILISRENHGLTKSLNFGTSLAKGEFLARMDADDIALPDRFQKQLTFLKDHPSYVAVGSKVMQIDSDGAKLSAKRCPSTHEDIDRRLLLGDGSAMVHPTIMVRLRAIHNIGGYNEEYRTAQDLDLFLRLAEVGNLFNLPDVLLHYRNHTNSVGRTQYRNGFNIKNRIMRAAAHRRSININIDAICNPLKQLGTNYDWNLCYFRLACRGGHYRTAMKHLRRSIDHYGLNWYQVKMIKHCIGFSLNRRLNKPDNRQ